MDWESVKAAYVATRSYKLTAERFGLNPETVKKRASRGGWSQVEGTTQGTSVPSGDKNGDCVSPGVPPDQQSQGTSVPSNEGSGDKGTDFTSPDVPPPPQSQGTLVPSGDKTLSPQGASSVPPIFAAEVTTFPNAMSPDCPAVDTVASILEAIKTGEFRAQIDNLRRILGRDGKTAYDREKTKLPAFCVSGTTADRKRLLKHSNLLQIDFDGLNGTLADARSKVVGDPHVAAAFTSPSGDGLKVLLRIDGFRHDDSVAAAVEYFSRVHGLKHDPQVKEQTRLCFVSYDPDLFVNPAATVFPLPELAGKAKKKEKPWWDAFKGDLHTLDIVAAFREAGLLGECLNPDDGKWAVKCPWADTHGDEGKDWDEANSSTIVFEKTAAFSCFHSHCVARTQEDAVLWLEANHPGIIERHCARLRGKFAAEALKKEGIYSAWGLPIEGAEETLITQNGEPFYFRTKSDGEREVADFNPHYWVARFAFENLVLFEPHNNQFYSYVPEFGIWRWQTDATIRADIAAWMLEYARLLNQPLLETGRTGDRLTHMLTILRAASERREPFRKFENIIHLQNCMIHLDFDPPQIHGFSPHYFSLSQCQVAFDPDADCPRFLEELIYASMSEEDAYLLQLAGGLYLTGRNNWQKMLILTGIGGAGKGTIGRIIGHIIGSQNVKQLRTRLLGDRFELDDLDQVSLLVGSDVPGDFLSCAGAKVIKALTGGDPLTLEFKGGRKRHLNGDHNLLITCNDRLRVQLDGDESAWHRRLLIIPFLTKPLKCTPDLDRILMAEEASGILNWFILGAIRLAKFAREGTGWPLSKEQQQRVDDMLAESDSLRAFIGLRIVRDPAASLTVDELVAEYENYCAKLGWVALTKAQAERNLGPLMMEIHRAAKRNDIKRGSSQRRGYMGVCLTEPTDQP